MCRLSMPKKPARVQDVTTFQKALLCTAEETFRHLSSDCAGATFCGSLSSFVPAMAASRLSDAYVSAPEKPRA